MGSMLFENAKPLKEAAEEQNADSQGRFRSKTIAFRMSPEEADLLKRMADTGGMTK